MLPIEQGHGQIWLRTHLLCDVEYAISQPLPAVGTTQAQRVVLTVPEEHCAALLDSEGLVLVIENGRRCPIPPPLRHLGLNNIECYVESPAKTQQP
jgi:hypothetical protein